MVVDEYHHAAAETYVRILTKHFTPKYLVGLTATPYRLDKRDIMKFVDGNISNDIDVFEGIEKDILVPFEYIGLWDNIDYTEIRWNGYRYNVGDLDRKLIIHKRDEEVINEYRNRIEPDNRLTIAFCNSVDHVHRITKKFNSEGILAAGVTYKESPEERQEILHNFRNGLYKVLFTRDILNEGVDFPECSAVMLLRPTISKTVFFQQIGRGLRKKEGKENVLVLDYIGNYQRAFKKKNWLKMFKKKDETTGEHIKPYYEYSPKIKIRFDQKVIEMMEIQQRTYDKSDIIENYLYVKKMENIDFLGVNDYGRSKYRKYDKKIFTRRFGNFRNFLIEASIIKEDEMYGKRKYPNMFFKCDDKEKLIDNYWNVKQKLKQHGNNKNYIRKMNNCPPSRYFDKIEYSKYGIKNYKRNWGTYFNFLVSIGEIDSEKQHISKPKTDSNIKLAIERLQKKLNRKTFSIYEWEKEYGGYCRTMIEKMGGFNEFRKKFDIYVNKCFQCGEEFENNNMRKRFCSIKCRKFNDKHSKI